MSSESSVSVPKSQIDRYESRIRVLERENSQLRDSKLNLVISTSKEIERLRQYIHSLTISLTHLQSQEHETADDPGQRDEKEEKSMVTPGPQYLHDDTAEFPLITLCQHCGRTLHPQKLNIAPGNEPPAVQHQNDNNQPAVEATMEEEDDDDYNHEHEDDEKQTTISSDDDDDGATPFSEYSEDQLRAKMDNIQLTPGRVSQVIKPGTRITRGNSVHLTAADLPSFHDGNEQSMGEHADIPLPDNFMDDSFVICDYCTSTMPLQFVRKYPDSLECSKCLEFFEYIFLCNECGKCVCSNCYEYEAKMQCVDQITNYFQAKENQHDDDGYSFRLILFQKKMNDESAATLHRIIASNCSRLQIDEFALKLCYTICAFMDDMDLCQMLEDPSLAGELFNIYWILSPPKISFVKKFGFSDINLLQTLRWAADANDSKQWSIKQIIDSDVMIQNYLGKNYHRITFESFHKKLTKYMSETNTNYEKLLDLLQLILNKSNIKHCEMLEYQQFAWRELGGAPSLCSRGWYFIWSVPVLQKSYCFNVDNRILDKPIL